MKKLLSLILAAGMTATAAFALTPAQLDAILAERSPKEIPAAVAQAATVEDKLAALGDPFAHYYTAEEYADYQSQLSEAGQQSGSTVTASLEDGHICHVAISAFGPDTYESLKTAVSANDNATDRWVVDLRGNGGGELRAAVDAMSVFLGKGDLVYLRGKGSQLLCARSDNAKVTIAPVIVLVDSRTASAAELFAANIRDRQHGIIIGSRTYGKGVAQTALTKADYPEAFADGSALTLTTHYTFSESLTTHNVMGVIPTLLVDDDQTEAVAKLLCSKAPAGNSAGFLRLHLGHWRWYVDLSQAQPPAFTALLEALPPQTDLYLGSGGNNWTPTDAATLAARYAQNYTSRAFPDVSGSKYAAAINTLKTYGIFKGNERGQFMPNATLDRASLCSLLAQAMGYPQSTAAPAFADTPADAWYTPYVTTLSQMGIVNGYGDGLFHPNDPIPHQQFMAILARIVANTNYRCQAAMAAGMTEEATTSGDYDAYADWARTEVWALDGWWHAPAKDIDPNAPTIRDEAASALHAALNGLGILSQ